MDLNDRNPPQKKKKKKAGGGERERERLTAVRNQDNETASAAILCSILRK